LQKEALKKINGLFIQPVIGRKKIDDFKDEYILTSYEILIDKYYAKKRVLLGVLPLKMRYAGPRESLFHAIIRKNYGCTHFIVGRDHAGVGNYYPPLAAQEIFEQFKNNEIGVKILKFPEVVYCSSIKQHTFIEHSPKEDAIRFSGTKLREQIKKKIQPPDYIIRPEVYNFLTNSYNSLVDDMYQKTNKNHKGFVIWLTGLSQSGKTTAGDKLHDMLIQKGVKTERLDGDIVRQHLSKDLGFTKEDRDENIRRVGFVTRLLSRNGVGVITSFISPYQKTRDKVRKQTENFVEVFCKCPLEECEKRDTKGLYKKARKGAIEHFTGISDPYEEPENPEIELLTDKETPEECVQKIIKYLEDNKLI
jgi:sulfate adenylyltransferase